MIIFRATQCTGYRSVHTIAITNNTGRVKAIQESRMSGILCQLHEQSHQHMKGRKHCIYLAISIHFLAVVSRAFLLPESKDTRNLKRKKHMLFLWTFLLPVSKDTRSLKRKDILGEIGVVLYKFSVCLCTYSVS